MSDHRDFVAVPDGHRHSLMTKLVRCRLMRELMFGDVLITVLMLIISLRVSIADGRRNISSTSNSGDIDSEEHCGHGPGSQPVVSERTEINQGRIVTEEVCCINPKSSGKKQSAFFNKHRERVEGPEWTNPPRVVGGTLSRH